MVDGNAEAHSDDDTLDKAPKIREWSRLLKEASQRFGKDLNVAQNHEQWMKDAGFKNVRTEKFKVCRLRILSDDSIMVLISP